MLVAARHLHVGFGLFPVIFSINLFLWFKPDWFYLQFAMIALGLAAKEWIRGKKTAGECTSSTPLRFRSAVFSLVLLATGASGITWARRSPAHNSFRHRCTSCCF